MTAMFKLSKHGPALLGLLSGLTISGAAFADTLVVPIDKSMRLTVLGSAASVLVGNPGVADVTVVDSHTLFVQGRGYGETDIVVLNDRGETLYSGEVVVGAASNNRVSIYRGSQRTDLACAPGCQVSVRSPNSGPAGAAAPGAASPAATGGTPMSAASNLGATAAAIP
jgi:Flp pilus assembly secretin CpaC